MEYLPSFSLMNYTQANQITVVRMSGSLICIGTIKGMVLQYDSSTMKILSQYQAHNYRVDDIWCQQGKAIISCSAEDSTR